VTVARRDNPVAIDIELLSEGVGADAAHDVSFGGRRRGPREVPPRTPDRDETADPQHGERWWREPRTLALTAAGLCILAVSVAVLRPTSDPAVSSSGAQRLTPSTVAPVEPPVVDEPEVPVTGDAEQPLPEPSPTPPTTEIPTTTTSPLGTSLTGGAPLIEADSSWGLYAGVGDRVYRIDLTTGVLDLIEEVAGLAVAVVPTPDGPFVRTTEDFGDPIILGPPGTAWRYSENGGVELSDLRTGAIIRTFDLPWEFPYLIGSDGAGDAFVYGVDGRVWVVRADGSVGQLPPGALLSLQAGSSVWVRCDDQGNCRTQAESAVGVRELAIPDFWLSSFSPDGAWLVYQTDSGRGRAPAVLLDLRTGAETELGSTLYGLVATPLQSAAEVVWTPDSRYFVTTTLAELEIHDTQTGSVVTVAIPDGAGNVIPFAIF
jgi:hypothetical protein